MAPLLNVITQIEKQFYILPTFNFYMHPVYFIRNNKANVCNCLKNQNLLSFSTVVRFFFVILQIQRIFIVYSSVGWFCNKPSHCNTPELQCRNSCILHGCRSKCDSPRTKFRYNSLKNNKIG